MRFPVDELIRCAVAVLLLLAGVAMSASMAAPAPVVVVAAEARELTPLVRVAGTVISRNDTQLAAQVEGQVTWVADVGTSLAAGDVAAQLDDVMIRAVLDEQQAQVTQAQANVTFRQRESQRLAQLAKDNNAALSRLDQAKRDVSIARSELVAANARVLQSREKLARTAIKAPFAAVVAERFIQAGEWADPGTAIVRLVDTATLEVKAWVPVEMLPYIHEHDELLVDGHAGGGIVRTLVPVGDEQSRLFELRLTLNESRLSVGQSVRIAIPTADSQQVTVVPRDALILRSDGIRVFRILEDNTAERVAVTTGIAAGDLIEVQGDIQPGDRVVIRGGERLRNGQEVKVSEQVPGK